MIRKNFAFASIAAALLASGTAFAAGSQPAAGEAPFFQAQSVAAGTSQVQRATVSAQAPLAGNLPLAQETVTSDLSRAQVREATREALAHGFRPASGYQS
ncbi:MAG: hypothetical protein K8F51_02975 [Comamonas sp.]|nr:hypothetical protein [Comamonas sp.]